MNNDTGRCSIAPGWLTSVWLEPPVWLKPGNHLAHALHHRSTRYMHRAWLLPCRLASNPSFPVSPAIHKAIRVPPAPRLTFIRSSPPCFSLNCPRIMPKSVSLVAAADQPPSTPPPFVQVSDGSTAEVCIRQINAHLEYYEKQCTQVALKYGAPTASASGPSSLVDLSVQQIIRSLRDDPTPESLEVVLKNTPPSLLPKVIQDPSLHYSVFRRWGKTHNIKKELVDVDEYVFLNERDMRTRPESEWDRILVTLEDGDGIWPESEIKDGVRALKRKLPPREHYAILGEKIPSELKIQGSSDSFKRRFDRMTDGILEGLNWNNVFVAGGMALSVLSCVDDDSEKQFMNSDIDLYIYGLSPEDGNAKAEEIWNVWSRNVGDKKKMVVRNAKVFTFLSEYPTRRVQVRLTIMMPMRSNLTIQLGDLENDFLPCWRSSEL